MPSFILIRLTVWRQYTNGTGQTDRQRSDSIGRTVLQTVAQKRHSSIGSEDMVLVIVRRVSPEGGRESKDL